jgi:acetylornithine/N-succinyldiaminopimelate aminotransferase
MPVAPGFLQHLRRRCDETGALLMLDEIQCGMGRSGRLFACSWDEVQPDTISLAKALGGGFPIGALLVGARAAETMGFGSHGTTFGGNPLAAAVARVALRILNAELDLFSEVRGRGLMQGAVLHARYAARAGEVLDAAAGHGLLMLQAGVGVLRFVPALNIREDELAEGLLRLQRALRSVFV